MELRQALKNFLDHESRLKAFPSKRKMKIYALFYMASGLNKGRMYTESQLNDALCRLHSFNDPATLRRELYNNRFIDRKSDGSEYWLQEPQPVLGDMLAALS